jgi:hypothetical protein
MLSNIYLHEVLDKWFEEQIKPLLESEAFMARYGDDFVMGFKSRTDAERVLAVLGKRLARYGLELHAEKTRLVDFRPAEKGGGSGTFDFLGFTHIWRESRKGKPYVGRATSKSRFERGIRKVSVYLRQSITQPLHEQLRGLGIRLQGHYNYYGMRGNSIALSRFKSEVKKLLMRSLRRRSGHHAQQWRWERFNHMIANNPLPRPLIIRGG